MSGSTNSLTSVRVNFLRAFEAKHGRQAVVSRQELLAFRDSWTPGEKGGAGLVLRFPSWLTNPNPNPYKVGRGNFKLPWDDLDAYDAAVKAAAVTAPAATTSPAPAGATV